jgi:hypothetical protein
MADISTAAGVIEGIDSVLAGALAARALSPLPSAGLLPSIAGGIAVFLLTVLAHQRYQARHSRRVQREVPMLFPAEPTSHAHHV